MKSVCLAGRAARASVCLWKSIQKLTADPPSSSSWAPANSFSRDASKCLLSFPGFSSSGQSHITQTISAAARILDSQFARKLSSRSFRRPTHQSAHGVGKLASSDEQTDRPYHSLWTFVERSYRMRNASVVQTITAWMAKGGQFTKRECSFVWKRLLNRRMFKEAMEVSDWLVAEKRFPLTKSDLCTHLRLLGKMGRYDEAEAYFQSCPAEMKSEPAYNAMIKVYCDRGLLEKATLWIHKLTKSGLLSQAFAFNRLLSYYEHQNMIHKVSEVLEELTKAGVKKDIYTYNILMLVKSKAGDVQGAQEIVKQVQQDGLSLNAVSYATLASAYINAGMNEKAMAILKHMEGIPRRDSDLCCMASLWGKVGKADEVEKIWLGLKNRSPSPRVFTVLISTFGALGMVDRAEQTYYEMEKRFGSLHLRHTKCLLLTYLFNGMVDEAVDFSEQLGKVVQKHMVSYTHHVVVRHLELGQVSQASKLLISGSLLRRGKPWYITMLLVLNALADKGEVEMSEELCDSIESLYGLRNVETYNALLRAYIAAKLPTDVLLDRMSGDNVAPNEETVTLAQTYL